MQDSKVCACSVYDEKSGKSRPGYRYDGGEYKYEFPCFTYDPLNQTSRKSAMKAALMTGKEEMERLRKEVEEEMMKEDMKKKMRHEKSEGSEDYD